MGLHITPSYKPAWIYGGPTLSVSRLCESLVAEGMPVHVYTTTANGPEELAVEVGKPQLVDGVRVTYFPRWTGDHSHLSPALLWQLWRTVRQYEVVHVHSWWNLVSLGAVLVCVLRGVRPVLSPRGMLSTYGQESGQSVPKRLFQAVLGKWLLRRTILHATARQEVKEGQRMVPDWPHFVAPNSIDLPERGQFPRSVRSGTEELQMIFLSRIHHKKGLDILFRSLADCAFPWQLTIVGDGEYEYVTSLQKQALELGLAERIHWHGWAEGHKRYELLAAADLFVLPSRNENFANVVLEALAVGTPVAVSDQVGMSEYVAKGKMGWVWPLSPSAWAQGLQRIAQSPAERERIAAEAPEWVYTEFAPSRTARNYLDQYRVWSR